MTTLLLQKKKKLSFPERLEEHLYSLRFVLLRLLLVDTIERAKTRLRLQAEKKEDSNEPSAARDWCGRCFLPSRLQSGASHWAWSSSSAHHHAYEESTDRNSRQPSSPLLLHLFLLLLLLSLLPGGWHQHPSLFLHVLLLLLRLGKPGTSW